MIEEIQKIIAAEQEEIRRRYKAELKMKRLFALLGLKAMCLRSGSAGWEVTLTDAMKSGLKVMKSVVPQLYHIVLHSLTR